MVASPSTSNLQPPRSTVPPEHQPSQSCENCPFGGPKVGSKGDPTSNWVLVGESPGANEVRTKIPFAGASGRILHTYAPEDTAYYLNAMECSPHHRAKDQRTLDLAARVCNPRLIRLIQAHPRRLIVAMGNPAVRSLTGDYTLKITQIRGQLIPSPLSELGILPVVHPAALIRGTGSFRQWREDLAYAKYLAEGGDPRGYEAPTFESILWGTTHQCTQALDVLWSARDLTADVETSGFDHKQDRLLSVGITTDGKHIYCFRPTPIVLRRLKPLLESKAHKWCWHNGKFDVGFFREQGIEARVDDDTILMSYTLDETRGVHDLEQVAQDVLDMPDYKYMIKPYLPKKNSSYELIPEPILHEYMSLDVGATARIRPVYRERIRQDAALDKLYEQTLIPASELLTRVESNGIHVDQEWIGDVDTYLSGELAEVAQEIQEICGRSVNPGSPAQMSEVLFKQFRLPNKRKGSTDKDTLKALAENVQTRHPIVLALQNYRKLAKAHGTYVKGLYKHIHPDGRVYSTYLLHGTVTGRLASRNPNLQNIPRDWVIRGIFCAEPGKILLEVDLSQAELRSLATLSGDPVMIALYNDNRSIHKELAKFLFGEKWVREYAMPIGTPEFTRAKEQYTKCKNVNFGIVYGITEFGLQDQIGGTLAAARKMIEGWANRFPTAWEFIGKCRKAPLNRQTIVTCFGRKKRVGLITSQNIKFLQNEASNFPHQSTASDITLHAAVRTEPTIRALGGKIVNLVHDSIIIETTQDKAVEIGRLVKNTMEQVPRDWGITSVPFLAEADIGTRWGSLEEFNDELKEAA